MIAFLRGKVLEADGESAVVDVAGVGYQVFVSASTAAALSVAGAGAETQLWVHSHFVRDEPLRLYGFGEVNERALFQMLINVQGVSPRIALALMAGLEASELVRAIAMDDVARLTQVKGVGRKTAERLALELREKILSVPLNKGVAVTQAPAAAKSYGDAFGDLYGVLVQLGYKQGEIEPLFDRLDPTRPVGELVREALSALRRQ